MKLFNAIAAYVDAKVQHDIYMHATARPAFRDMLHTHKLQKNMKRAEKRLREVLDVVPCTRDTDES